MFFEKPNKAIHFPNFVSVGIDGLRLDERILVFKADQIFNRFEQYVSFRNVCVKSVSFRDKLVSKNWVDPGLDRARRMSIFLSTSSSRASIFKARFLAAAARRKIERAARIPIPPPLPKPFVYRAPIIITPSYALSPPLPESFSGNKCIFTKRRSSFIPPPSSQVYSTWLWEEILHKLLNPLPVKRSPTLAFKLRSIISSMRFFSFASLCSQSTYISSILKKPCMPIPLLSCAGVDPEPLQGEMDEDASGAAESPRQIQASNVVIESQRDDSVAQPDLVDLFSHVRMSGGSSNSNYEEMCNRWLLFDQFEWGPSSDSCLRVIRLPLAVLAKYKSQPNIMPFNIFRYWHGDMEIRAELNSNKFQVGQLQISWYYCSEEDKNFGLLRKSKFSCSYRDHFLLSAGSSNSGSMYIPYRHYLSQLVTKSADTSYMSSANMGSLVVNVLNVLTVPSATYSQCNVSLFIRFVNSKFSGMINYNTDSQSLSAQMMSASSLLGMGRTFLRAYLSDSNRDNPPEPSPSSFVTPLTGHSACSMTGITEPINPLRMDLRGQTPHIDRKDEMSIVNVCGVFGLVKTFSWNANQHVGFELFSCDASPILDVNEYNRITVGDISCYELPPVAVLSSCFAYWRGELEFRFDIIASQFHTGRFAVHILPGSLNSLSYIDARSSPHTVFDLAENRSFSFRVPYIANRPWWPRRISSSLDASAINPPSVISCYVVNPLIPMDSVSNIVEVNVYMRGAPSFELSIPVAPSIGLSFNTLRYSPPSSDKISPLGGCYPFFCTFYYYFDNTKLTLFYSNVAGKLVQFTDMDETKVYACPKTSNVLINGAKTDLPWRLQTKDGISVTHLVRVRGYPYNSVYCFSTYDSAKHYVATGNATWALDYKGSGPYCQVKLPGSGATWATDRWDSRIFFTSVLSVSLSGDMDQKRDFPNPPADLIAPVPTTNSGLLTFGECVQDLKDVCRRYNRYLDIDVTVLPISPKGVGSFFANFPVMFQRCELQIDAGADSVDNRMREGLIPVIASGYRFALGGVRFKILFSDLSPCDYVVVQFRPDHPCYDNSLRTKVDNVPHSYTDVLDFNYPCVYQGMVVNNCIEFEVPCYLTGDFALLQAVNFGLNSNNILREFASLGHIYMFLRCDVTKPKSLSAKVLYSLADDASFSVFQGFPPIFFLDQLPSSVYTPRRSTSWLHVEDSTFIPLSGEMDDKTPKTSYGFLPNVVNMFSSAKKVIVADDAISNPADKTVNLDTNLRTQSFVSRAIGAPTKVIAVVEKAESTLDSLSDIVEMIKGMIWGPNGISSKFENLFSLSIDWTNVIGQIISQIGHVLLNATFSTILWALCSLLGVIFGVGSKLITSISTFYKSIADKFSSKSTSASASTSTSQSSPNQQNSGEKLTGQMGEDFTDTEWTSLASIMVCGTIALANVAVEPPKNLKSLTHGLFTNTRHVAGTINSVTHFFRDNFTLLHRCYSWVVYQCSSPNAMISVLSNESDAVYKWAGDVISITTSPMKERVPGCPTLTAKTYSLNATASMLAAAIAANTYRVKNISYIQSLIKSINKLTENLLEDKINSPARYEPFVIWVTGPAGVGKSFMIDDICIKLLKDTGYESTEPPIFTRTPGVAYWNGLKRQPVCKIDDMCAVNSPEFGGIQMAEMFNLKSSATLNPPMADLSDKKIFYNPLIVAVCANNSWPKPSGLNEPDALYRRRDALVHVGMIPKFKGKRASQLDSADLVNNAHLAFNVIDDPSIVSSPYSSTLSFDDYYNTILLPSYKKYIARETVNYRERLNRLTCLYPTTLGESITTSSEKLMDELFVSRRESVLNDKSLSGYVENYTKYVATYLKDPLDGQMGESSGLVLVEPEAEDDLSRAYYVVNFDRSADSTKFTFKDWIDGGFCPHEWIMHNQAKVFKALESITFEASNDTYLCGDNVNDTFVLPNYPCVLTSGINCSECPFSGTSQYDYYNLLMSIFPETFRMFNSLSKNHHMHFPSNYISCFRTFSVIAQENNKLKACIEEAKEKSKDMIQDTVEVDGKKKTINYTVKTWKEWFSDSFTKAWGWVKSLHWVFHAILAFAGTVLAFFGMAKIKGHLEGKYNDGESCTPRLDATVSSVARFPSKCWSTVKGCFVKGDGSIEEEEDADLNPELEASGDTHQRKLTKTHRMVARKLIQKPLTGQSGPGADVALFKKINQNTFFLQTLDGNATLTGRCIGLHDLTFLILQHYLDRFKACNQDDILMIRQDCALPLKLSELKVLRVEQSGYCVAELPKRFNRFSNILSYIVPSSKCFDYDPNCVLISKIGEGFCNIHQVYVKSKLTEVVPASKNSQGWKIIDGFEYGVGGVGMCGSLLVTFNKKQPFIIGIHTAGAGGTRGVSEALVRDTFIIDETIIDPLSPNIGTENYDDAVLQLHTAIIPLRKLAKREVVRLSDKTKIRPSEIQGVFPVLTEPVPLSPRDPRFPKGNNTPLVAGCNKRGHPVYAFPEEDVLSVYEDIRNLWIAECKPIRNIDKELSFEQVIEGIDIAGYEKMQMKTSEGYPWVKQRPKSAVDKRWLFDWDETETKLLKIDPGLSLALDQQEEMMSRGVVPPYIFVACPKDSRVLQEKVSKEGAARIFEISPVDLTILTRKYFLDFCSAYSYNNFRCENTIGINVNGPDWVYLQETLTNFSPYIIDMDYSNYGPSAPLQVMYYAFEAMADWYDHYGAPKASRIIRQCISHATMFSYNLAHDFLFQVISGLPSGSAPTIYLNSEVNSFLIRLAFLGLALRSAVEFYDISLFAKKVKIFHNGDDLIMAVKPEIISWFNCLSIQSYFAEFKIKITPAMKTSVMKPYCSIWEVQYLKCKFVPHPSLPSRILAQLELSSVTDCANWIWECADTRAASLVNSEAAVRLAYGHGPQEFSRIRQAILSAWQKRGVRVSLPSWKQLDNQIWLHLKPLIVFDEEPPVDFSVKK